MQSFRARVIASTGCRSLSATAAGPEQPATDEKTGEKRTVPFFVFAAICMSGAISATARAQEPTLDLVLSRAGAYVATLQQQLRGIVAEETYVQRGFSPRARLATVRTLKSDLLLVRIPPFPDYLEFRDTFEVDGQPVRDRGERLTKLFLQDALPRNAQLQQVVDESARYNVGSGIPRTLNTPLLTLTYLAPIHQPRIRFRRAGHRQPKLDANPAVPDRRSDTFKVPPGTWAIEFDERRGPTVVRRANLSDFPARGTLWVDPMTGAVLVSELVLPSRSVSATIMVNYQSEPLLGFRVPVAMDERYRTPSERVDAFATYGHFRQFQVKTDERIGKPPPR